MRLVVNGKFDPNWDGDDVETTELRGWITKDGSSGFKAESGRYHLYVSWVCPWAHRTIIFRKLKQLESHIGMSIVSPNMFDNGWVFDKKTGSSGDTLFDVDCMHEIYTKSHSDYTGRVSVPVLWDKKQIQL